VARCSTTSVEIWTTSADDGGHHHLTDPWPRRKPLHGAAKDGVPIKVKLGNRQLGVTRVVTKYQVNQEGEGRVGVAFKLQLEDYRRVVVFHADAGGWFIAS
jgi:hypothetical protein